MVNQPRSKISVEVSTGRQPSDMNFGVMVDIVTNRHIIVKRVEASVMSEGECILVNREYARGALATPGVISSKQHFADNKPLEHIYDCGIEHGQVLHEGKDQTTTTEFAIHGGVCLPSNLPDTWSFKDGRTEARTRTWLNIRFIYCLGDGDGGHHSDREETLIRELELTIQKSVFVDQFNYGEVRSNTEREGPVDCSLYVLNPAIVVGHPIPIAVNILNNGLLPTGKASLTLFKEYSLFLPFFRPEECERHLVRIKKVKLPKVSGMDRFDERVQGLVIPTDVGTSCSTDGCNFAKVRFFVRLEVKLFPVGHAVCDVDVTVCTEFESILSKCSLSAQPRFRSKPAV